LLLTVAGTLKLADPRPAAGSLRRVSATLSRQHAGRLERAVRSIGLAELAAALASTAGVGGFAVAVSGAAGVVVLCIGFLWFTNLARRRGAACGCWGSLSDGPAGGAEVARRGVLLVASMLSFAATATHARHAVSAAVAAAVMVAGVAAGLALATPRHRLGRLVRSATMGVSVAADAQRAVNRRVRRSTLETLRSDQHVRALLATMPSTGIEWRHARVTSAQRRNQLAANRLVAVPGASGNLRIVAGPTGALVAIGESAEAIYTLDQGEVHVARKGSYRTHPTDVSAGRQQVSV
jgi:hypothetical protein